MVQSRQLLARMRCRPLDRAIAGSRESFVMATDWFQAAGLPTNCLMLARTVF
jgi:hypothetical protein